MYCGFDFEVVKMKFYKLYKNDVLMLWVLVFEVVSFLVLWL